MVGSNRGPQPSLATDLTAFTALYGGGVNRNDKAAKPGPLRSAQPLPLLEKRSQKARVRLLQPV